MEKSFHFQILHLNLEIDLAVLLQDISFCTGMCYQLFICDTIILLTLYFLLKDLRDLLVDNLKAQVHDDVLFQKDVIHPPRLHSLSMVQ